MYKPLMSMAAALAFSVVGTACAAQADKALPAGDYQQVSELVPLPEFIPGMGSLYVQPSTLPAGPFLAYDRDNTLVSSIYMIPLKDMNDQKAFENLAVGDDNVESVELQYNAGHPGVAEPHYHIVLWHVAKADAKLK